jgi:signal transduction histidine kinase
LAAAKKRALKALTVAATADRQAAIQRAKLEWEGTVDALASLVCLLGRDGQVLRANRVVEDWSLGKVNRVIGRQAHDLLHPDCSLPDCELAAFVGTAVERIMAGVRRSFETHLVLGRRKLNLVMMPMRLPTGPDGSRSETLAVLIADDVSALHRAQDALERLNVTLEGRVRSRTQALAQANLDLRNEVIRREVAEKQLRTSRDELAVLSAQLIRAQEGERKRIAQELHDSVGQSLSAVKYTVERALELLRQPKKGGSAAVLELAVKRIQETAESIRAISMNLRPAILDDLGVASALRWFCRDFEETYPSLTVSVELGVEDRDVPDRLATVVYRCAQELFNNVAKHADANVVRVHLVMAEHELQLIVEDDGVGVEASTSEERYRGSGLRNLRERAQMTGGSFSIASVKGGGTLARLSWPLTSSERRKRQRNRRLVASSS